MGSGADASLPVVTSICSGVDSSMACSWGAGRIMALGIRPLRDQHSPPENFTGLGVSVVGGAGGEGEGVGTEGETEKRVRVSFVGSHGNSALWCG